MVGQGLAVPVSFEAIDYNGVLSICIYTLVEVVLCLLYISCLRHVVQVACCLVMTSAAPYIDGRVPMPVSSTAQRFRSLGLLP